MLAKLFRQRLTLFAEFGHKRLGARGGSCVVWAGACRVRLGGWSKLFLYRSSSMFFQQRKLFPLYRFG